MNNVFFTLTAFSMKKMHENITVLHWRATVCDLWLKEELVNLMKLRLGVPLLKTWLFTKMCITLCTVEISFCIL